MSEKWKKKRAGKKKLKDMSEAHKKLRWFMFLLRFAIKKEKKLRIAKEHERERENTWA